MVIPPASTATPDERIAAALAHGSTILFGFGFIVPLIIWITQRKKSAFASFHYPLIGGWITRRQDPRQAVFPT